VCAGVFDRSRIKVNFKITVWRHLPHSATKALISLFSHSPTPLAVAANLPGTEVLPRIHGPSGPFDVSDYPKAMLTAVKSVATGRFDLNIVYARSQPPQLRAPGDLIVGSLSDLQLGLAFAVAVYLQADAPFPDSLPLADRVRPHIEVENLDAMTAVASDALGAEKLGAQYQPQRCACQADRQSLSQACHGIFLQAVSGTQNYP
jgi:hypothetical protein